MLQGGHELEHEFLLSCSITCNERDGGSGLFRFFSFSRISKGGKQGRRGERMGRVGNFFGIKLLAQTSHMRAPEGVSIEKEKI
jgi:hypothetical protein